ncbi:unnamed protein product [Didymodactylos carnosus]|uniref:Carbonic anhydrase n=1 Tax=Didymodactylos carnosus TaxID=1234261 RepID=A0A814YSE5_9BILA|nr:unnamed protein product [Didymodactylos carnosus]CAF1234279.1 unnamed protein product [Didymodactylos carnosus]CAF3811155.1 unnamed protein product [Didymodactylos carnosus]CAF3996825.1 unnamed protein product [Didymodactylos carnosus]
MSCTDKCDDHWSYDDPSKWSEHFPAARGLSQSPINIELDKTVAQLYPPFVFSPNYNTDEVLFTLTNTGHQVAVTLAGSTNKENQTDLSFTGGGLTGTFHFVNFHLHWGQNDRHGSEHEIEGKIFPAEAHFVHMNYETEQLAVFAFFFTVDDQSENENTEWRKYIDVADRLVNINDTANCTFNLSQLMQTDGTYFFRYMGSLTTPPCTEGVIWTIFPSEIPVKEESLDLLRDNIMRKVYRPVQPINDRIVFRSYQA